MDVLNVRFKTLNEELESARGKRTVAEDALAEKTKDLNDYKAKNDELLESLNQKVSDLETQLATIKKDNELLDLEVLDKLLCFYSEHFSAAGYFLLHEN